MESAPIVTLIAVFLAIVVVAAFLITVTYQLHHVHSRLKTILGVVGDVIEKTSVLDPVIGEISGDLAAGDAALEQAVERLKARKGITDAPAIEQPALAGSQAPAPEAPPPIPAGPPPHTFTNY